MINIIISIFVGFAMMVSLTVFKIIDPSFITIITPISSMLFYICLTLNDIKNILRERKGKEINGN